MTLPLIAALGLSACVHRIKAETWRLGAVHNPIKTIVRLEARYGTPEWEREATRLIRAAGFTPPTHNEYRQGYAATRAARRVRGNE